MKKAIIYIFVFALLTALLCGCTPPETETGQADASGSLPALQTEKNQSADQHGESGADTQTDPADADPKENGNEPGQTQNPEQTEAAETQQVPVSEYDDDPEMATASDFVVDGGSGHGIGGN